MAGLLDLFNSPEGQQALGLLAAGGPQTDPSKTGFGQRLAAASGFADQWKKRQSDAQMDALKMQMFTEELALKKLAEKRAQGTFDVQQKFLESFGGGLTGGQQTSPMGPGPSSTGASAPMPNSGGTHNGTPMGAEGQKLNQLRIAALLGVPGAKELFDIHKYENSPEELKPGSTYQNRTTGVREYMPLNEKGMLPDPNTPGGVIPQPGFSGINAKIKGDEAGAIERAKAGYELVEVPNGDGTTSKMPRTKALDALSGGQPQAGFSSADMARIYADAAQRGVTPDIRYTPGAGTFGRTQSPAQQAREVETAKADVVRDTTKQGETKRYGQLMATADRALELLNAGPTNSAIGSGVDKVAGWVGQSTKGAEIAAELKTLSGWMTANVPRMEGPQSNIDVEQYKVMAGVAGDDRIPIPQRIAAVKQLKMLQEKYAELNGAAPAQSDKPKAAAMDTMPKANPSNKGRKIRDTETGKILQSNGMTWVEVK